MNLCDMCKLKDRGITTIMDFPFKIYESKEKMSDDLRVYIEKDPFFLTYVNPKWKSNIIHEIVYTLVRATYHHRIYRKQHTWALEILKENYQEDFNQLIQQKNCKNEIPLECLIRLFEDKQSKYYLSIMNLIKTDNIIILTEPIGIESDINTNIDINTDKKIIQDTERKQLNPYVAQLTQQYHILQSKLFDAFEKKYSDLLHKCEKCNKTIDMFDNIDPIIERMNLELYSNRMNRFHYKWMSKIISKIIELRTRSIELNEDDEINRRHKHILKYFIAFQDLFERYHIY